MSRKSGLQGLLSQYKNREQLQSDDAIEDGEEITHESVRDTLASLSDREQQHIREQAAALRRKSEQVHAQSRGRGAAGGGRSHRHEESVAALQQEFLEFKKELIKKFTTKRVPPQSIEGIAPHARQPIKRPEFVSKPGISEYQFEQLIKKRNSLYKTTHQFKNKLKVMLFRGTHVLTYDAKTNQYIPLKLDGRPIFWNELTLNEMLGQQNVETGEFVFDDKELIDQFVENHAILWDSCVEEMTLGGTKHLLEPFLTSGLSSMPAPDTAITSVNQKIKTLTRGLNAVTTRIRDRPVTVIDYSSYLTRIKIFLLDKTGAGTASSVLTNMIIYFQETVRAVPSKMASEHGHILGDSGMAMFRPFAETEVYDAEELEQYISELAIYLIAILGAICIFPESAGQFILFFNEIQMFCMQIFGTAYAVNNYEEVSLIVGEYLNNLIKDSISAYDTAARQVAVTRENISQIGHHMYLIKSYVMNVFAKLSGPSYRAAAATGSLGVRIRGDLDGIRREIEIINHLYGFDPERETALQYFSPTATRVRAARLEENPFYGMEIGGSRKRSKRSGRNKKSKRKTNRKK